MRRLAEGMREIPRNFPSTCMVYISQMQLSRIIEECTLSRGVRSPFVFMSSGGLFITLTPSILSSWSCYDWRGGLRGGVASLLEVGSGIAGGGAFTDRVRRAGQLHIL